MDFLRRIRDHIRHFESRYPGAIFLALVIALLAVGDLFFKATINDYRYIWYRLYESGGKALFHFFGGSREIDIDQFYDSRTWILSIKHQVASVLAMYALSSRITWKRGFYAVSWFVIIQLVGIIKYAVAIKLSLTNPDNLFAQSEQTFHLVLWLVPFITGMRTNNLPLRITWKQGATHPQGKYCLLITRIFAILILMSSFRIIDHIVTHTFFGESFLSLWEAGSYLSNEILRWPVIHGANIVLQQFMYETYVAHHSVTDGLTNIYLGAPCLGKGVLVVFSVIILLTNTVWQHKLWCIISGLAVLILFNIARMSLLFAYVFEFGSSSYNYGTWHDIYSSIIYLAIVGLWILCTSNKTHSPAPPGTYQS